jgi:hypothetical protein
MMLEIEVFYAKSRFLQNSGLLQFARRARARHGKLGISALWSSSPLARHGEKTAGQAKLTAQHVLSIRFVASMDYPRLELAVPY